MLKLPFLKCRADASSALANLGIMPPVTVITRVYYQCMEYDRTPPAPGNFGDAAAILGVERVGHALRERALGRWLTLDRAEQLLASLAQELDR